ncbi:MAG: SIMPL domain-containing protein [Pirellulales bacterium]
MKNILLPLLLAAAPLHAQMLPRPSTPEPSLVTVQGRGEIRIPNTIAVVQLGFEAAGPDEAPVRQDVTQRSQAVITALKAEEKVGKLETTAVNIRPQFTHSQPEAGKRPQPPKITGYIAQVAVSYESPVEDAGRLISSMMENGANSVSNMFTRPTVEARRTAENEALTLAAQDGEAQARALLAALNLQWTVIRSIDATSDHFDPRPMPRAAMMMAAESAPLPELDIQGGETVMTREVTLQVEFRPL